MPLDIPPNDVHNQRLLGQVHPPDWINPEPAACYNLVVLGAGTAGLVAAAGAAGLGARVALVERRLMGGDCLNVGCVPSKALLRCAKTAAQVRAAAAFGVGVPPDVPVNFPAVMERMRRLRAEIAPHDSAARFRDLGVDVFLGQGQFTGPNTVVVDGRTLRFRRAAICTGARAAVPPIPGLREAAPLTNETVFSLTELPPLLAVIGAGPIGCELAQAFARFGSRVTLLEVLPRILAKEDPDAAAIVESALHRDGMEILTGAQISRVEIRGNQRVLHVEGRPEIVVDAILIGAGRLPNVEHLGLESVGVAFDPKKGVTVNDRLQTTNSRIYAAGDVCSRYQFTHMADALARIVIQNALFFGRRKASALVVPWCTFTDPEIAHVGLSEPEANERGISTDTFLQPLQEVDRAILDGETEGFVKILVRRGSDRILGATIVASHAGDLISEITLAIAGSLGLRTIAATIHPYPTQAEAIKKIADAYQRTRLTPFIKRLFEKLMAWRR
jgi:pyruvate/2-oxoglutarate dehydrogenase complex dihydrolipoamide dehydrogenase (E3) component